MTESRSTVRLPRKLGELGVPVEVLPLGTSFAEVIDRLEAEPLLPGVLIASGSSQILLSRTRAEQLTMGRLGFGSVLPSRRIVEPADGIDALALSSDTDVDLAAQAALARPIGARDEPVVVCWRDGRYGIAPVIGLLTAMAGRYARLARADQLTGLPNRSAALTEGRQRLEAGKLAAVLHLGLDRFQDANDMLGTQGADVLLQRVAAGLRTACRAEDLTARLEGDQFVVLLAEPAPAEGLIPIARRLADALRGPYTVNGIPVSIETSIGIAATDHRDLPVVLRRAADTLRSAKAGPDRRGALDRRHGLHPSSRPAPAHRTAYGHPGRPPPPALPAAGLRPLPRGPRVRGAGPLAAPAARASCRRACSCPDAERSDVILELTDWVLAEAIHQAAVWHRGGADTPVSVNLSAAYLAQERAVPTILALLALEQLPARLLTLEITETAVLARPDEAAARLTSMRALGIRVSIDDFGTGYTSLGLLPELPIDELKIDRSFVMRMLDSQARATIIHSVIAIARSLDLTVVAEGIEDEPTAAALAAADVDLLQGYHLGRPAPATEFTQNSGDRTLQSPLVGS